MNDDTAQDLVWRALADPSRRRLLDLLADGPRTTGALCAAFDVSRFAVMKHLRVLEDAGLVIARRNGRERFNHLNGVPLREAYERFMRPHADRSAAALLALRRHVEERPEEDQMSTSTVPGVRAEQIAQETRIRAPRGRVWHALTEGIDGWWEHRAGDGPSTVTLDARVGGQFGLAYGDGAGWLWGVVARVEPGRMLELSGPLGMPGAVVNVYRYELSDDGDGTLVRLTHDMLGTIDDERVASYTKGWRHLIDVRLRELCEAA
jgi:DNA-binding transcriptional ArsR family regulator/uncharacterized protein YndB with AHSA1/START domain